jgi:hypothetical protein
MTLLSFMLDEEATVQDTTHDAVAEIIRNLPVGSESAGCLFLWYGVSQKHDISLDDFDRLCATVARTELVYGVRHIVGVDAAGVRDVFNGFFR